MINAKPFLKWAGGKTQVLSELINKLPETVTKSKIIDSYIEPFVGWGAFIFYLKNNYEVKKSYLLDKNIELIIGYKVIQNNPTELIKKLKKIKILYFSKNKTQQCEFFYEIREIYNNQRIRFDYKNYNKEWIERVSYSILLNKTCFNGLFRLNKNGGFNVPFGGYVNPKICDEVNILEVNKALKDTMIICGDFSNSEDYIDKNSIVYFDPPYRPINKTSSFTTYSSNGFTDEDQKRLATFYNKMSKKGAYLILSNSDSKNNSEDDDFFDRLYKRFKIYRILANRMINCNGNKRGKITEILITNYRWLYELYRICFKNKFFLTILVPILSLYYYYTV